MLKNLEFYFRNDGRTFAFFEKNEFDLGEVVKINFYTNFKKLEIIYNSYEDMRETPKEMVGFLEKIAIDTKNIINKLNNDSLKLDHTNGIEIMLKEKYDVRIIHPESD